MSKWWTQFKCIPQYGIRIEPLSTHWIRIQEILDRMELFLHLNIWLSFTACKSNSLIVIWSHIWIRADMLSCYNMLSKPFRSHTKVLELLVSTCHLINFVWEKQTSISNINFKFKYYGSVLEPHKHSLFKFALLFLWILHLL